MAITVEELVTVWGFKVDRRPLDQARRGIQDVKSSLLGLSVGFAAIGAGIGVFIKAGAEFEQTKINFETILGGADAAKAKLKELSDFAVRTPFTIPEVEQNAKQLLAYSIEAENLIPTMKMLGDVSAGLSVPLSRLVLNFGQVKTQGKLTGRELKDFAIAGVPLISVLAKNLGVAQSEIADLVSAGKIGFPEVKQAFIAMSSGSGQFANLMEKQSKSFFGILSNIQDDMIRISRSIGLDLIPEMKELASSFRVFLNQNRELIKLRLKGFIMDLVDVLRQTVHFFTRLSGVLKNVAKPFGGIEKLLSLLIKAFFILAGARLLIGLGRLATAGLRIFGGLNKIVKITPKLLGLFSRYGVLRGFGVALRFVAGGAIAAQASLLAIPIAIVAVVAALVLVVDDLIAFFNGDNSVIGKILQWLRNSFPKTFDLLKSKIEEFKASLRLLKHLSLFIFNAISKKVKEWADKVTGFLKPVIDLNNKLREGFMSLLGGFGKGIKDFFVGKINSDFKEATDANLKRAETFNNLADALAKMNQANQQVNNPTQMTGGNKNPSVNQNTNFNAEIKIDGSNLPANQIGDAVRESMRDFVNGYVRQANRSAGSEVFQ